MSRHLREEDRVGEDFLTSIVILILVGGLFAIVWGVMALYAWLGLALFAWVVGIPVGLVAIWFMGHVINGLRRGTKKKCIACPYRHGNFITEWWHNRRCLPLQIMKVAGKANESGERVR